MDKGQLEARFEEAKAIASKASLFLLSHEDLRSEIDEKGENDYVTSADRECERMIISAIKARFPEDPVLGEESGRSGHRQGEVFSAMRGCGAFLNGRRISTDEKTPLGESLAILVPPHRHHEHLKPYLQRMERFYSVVSDMRSIGSAAASLCYVACGRVSMYYELGLHIYDLAAGAVILTEAGGRITFFTQDESWLDIAASSASAHAAMLECING